MTGREKRTADGGEIEAVPPVPTCDDCGATLDATGACVRGCPPARVVRLDEVKP